MEETERCIYKLPFACYGTYQLQQNYIRVFVKEHLVTPQRRMMSVVAGIFLVRKKCDGLKYSAVI
jgi:hypothetical protein